MEKENRPLLSCTAKAPATHQHPDAPCLLGCNHTGAHIWEGSRAPEPPPQPCLQLTPILRSIALELEIRNRKDELAAALSEHPASCFIVGTSGPAPHIEKQLAENRALHERLRSELAEAIARREPNR